MNVNKSEIELAWVPVLHAATKWEKTSDNKFLLCNEFYDTKMIVSLSSILIVSQIDGNKTIKDITDKLTKGQSTAIDYDRVFCFVKDQLSKNGILESDTMVIKKNKSHLHLERIIIPENVLYEICKPFVLLFNKKNAFYVIVACLASCIWAFSGGGEIGRVSVSYDVNVSVFLIAFIFIILFHELGHCVAMQAFGKCSKGVGFAFYFFSPVLFSDVSPSWTLSPKKRMIIDLGGFYFQFILTSVYLIVYQLTNNYSLLYAANMSFIMSVFNMNPLIKTDMYWFLADALNRYNLNDDARKEFVHFMKNGLSAKINLFLLLFMVIKCLFMCFVFVLVSYSLTKVVGLLLAGTYEITLENIYRDIIWVVGFLLFVKELFLALINRGRYRAV